VQKERQNKRDYPGYTFPFKLNKQQNLLTSDSFNINLPESTPSSSDSAETQNIQSTSSFEPATPVIYEEHNWHGAKYTASRKGKEKWDRITHPTSTNRKENWKRITHPTSTNRKEHSQLYSHASTHPALNQPMSKIAYTTFYIRPDKCILNKANVANEKDHALIHAALAFKLSNQ
jgi:hypothetical protein